MKKEPVDSCEPSRSENHLNNGMDGGVYKASDDEVVAAVRWLAARGR